MNCFLVLFLLVAILTSLGFYNCARFEPYSILGVTRHSDSRTIRAAYKKLARQWHPDKNTDPESESKFIEINKAYELLSDPQRKLDYDNYGITEERSSTNRNHGDQFRRQDPFSQFFSSSFKFDFNDEEKENTRLFHKQSISYRTFNNVIIPDSLKKPYLILFYSDWCFSCLRVEPTWRRLTEELEPLGFGIATVHTEYEKELARKSSVKELPHFVVVMNERLFHYKEAQFSFVKVLEFIRRKFPYKLVEDVNDDNIQTFLSGWIDNRIRILFFGSIDIIRLRYLTSGFKYRHRALFGYVKLHQRSKCEKIIEKFSVPTNKDTLLLFKEDIEAPFLSLSMNDISLESIDETLKQNQFLQLPRLSSQQIFDQLCPTEASFSRKRLCVVLLTADHPKHDDYRRALREFSVNHSFSASKRVRFTYVFYEKQSKFIAALHNLESNDYDVTDSLKIAIIWRLEPQQLTHMWLPNSWNISSQEALEVSTNQLKITIKKALKANKESFPGVIHVDDLINEHAKGFLDRLVTKIFEQLDSLRDSVSRDELLPAVSLVGIVAFLVAGGYFMNYLVQIEEESVRRQLGPKGMKVDKKGRVVPELRIHELRAETYNGMVRLLKPGCRTIVLIVDAGSKNKLVAKFYKLAWPYRRTKTLLFGYLYIEKGLPWYKKILNLTLPEPREININPKNCIGTVLSLNGHRRYFCMFHEKHQEGPRRDIYHANNGSVAGAFMGFDTPSEQNESDTERGIEHDIEAGHSRTFSSPDLDDSSSHDQLPIFEDQLLDGLQMWFDRLFEGSTYRYHINYWPEFPISPVPSLDK